MSVVRQFLLACTAIAAASGTAMAVPTCTHLGYGAAAGAKPNKLYLYFPAADDATFPEFGIGLTTSPAHRFDAAELTNYTGTTAALRDAVFDVVTDDYCEFNVEVLATTATPPTTAARRNTVAVGTDSNGGTWGFAQNVDTGDPTLVDFARVWAGTYNSSTALTGANSTLERWARSIGGTAAHEGGHNYGISHADGTVVGTGEDALTRHIMASGSNYTDEQRAGYRRHFSDREYSILASNVGLSVQTMWNWDFVNPNAQAASAVRISFLSTQASLTVAGPYTGPLSPWGAPTVSASLGTTVFKGTTYNRFQVTWSTAQAWNGPTPGVVAGGASFHVGTGFTGVDFNLTDPIIITQVDLLNASNAVLALHPRLVGFDSGALDSADGSFAINAVNFAGRPLLLSNVQVAFFPRLVSINSMVPRTERMTDIFGEPLRPWRQAKIAVREARVTPKATVPIRIARLADERQFVQVVDDRACGRGDRLQGPDTAACRKGMTVALFPATTFLVRATVTDPAARHWDQKAKRYVVGPVRSEIFMQVAGRHPDLNRNGVDDYLDIAIGKARDGNRDGVIDEVQRRKVNR